MKQVSCTKAVKFGFSAFFKKPLFFIGIYLITVLIMIVSFIFTLALSCPFFKPFVKSVSTFSAIWNISRGGIFAYIRSHFLISVGVIIGIIILYVINKMVYDYLILGLTKIAIDFFDKGQSSIKRLFPTPSEYFRYFIASSAYGFIMWFGALIAAVISFIVTRFITIPASPYVSFYKMGIMCIVFVLFFMPFGYLLIKYWFYSYFIVDQGIGPIESLKKSYDLKGGFTKVICMMLIFFAIGVFIGIIFYYMLPIYWSVLLKVVVNIFIVFASLIGGAFLYKALI